MDTKAILTARYDTCLRHLAAEVALLQKVTDLNTPFPYGEDVRANHRRTIEMRLSSWAVRLDENIRALADFEATA